MNMMDNICEEVNSFCEKLVFFVNGKKIEDGAVDPHWTILYYLRNKLYLYGTRTACREGGCGCCTIMVSRYDNVNRKEIHFPVNSCIVPICHIHGFSLTTVEGIGSRSHIHPVQERIVKAHGMQCGYCSPGFVMSMYSLLRQNPKPKMEHIAEAFQGNLCRCTGYRPLVEGFRTFSEEWVNKHEINSCRLQREHCSCDDKGDERLFKPEEFMPFDGFCEPDFPSELKITDMYSKEYLKIKGSNTTWLRPTTLDQIYDIKYKHPTALIVAGNTITRFEIQLGKSEYPLMVSVSGIPEMTEMFVTKAGLRIGAAASLENIREFLQEQILEHPVEKTKLFSEITNLIHWMASKQVRSVCTIGGNIMAKSTTCDLIPILLASRSILEAHSKKEKRFIIFDGKTVGKTNNGLHASEILVAIHLPFSNKNQYFKVYKQSRRREVDVSIVNFAVKVEFEEATNVISSIFFGLGDVSNLPIVAPKTEKKLKGLPWNKNTLKLAYSSLLEDIHLDMEAPGGKIRYRQCLALGLFLRSYLAISKELRSHLGNDFESLFEETEFSGILKFDKKEYKFMESFPVAPADQSPDDAIQRPMVRPSALNAACGETGFLDDRPSYTNELFLAYVWSTRAHANIVALDASPALKLEGVHAFLSEEDISKEVNQTGAVFKGDEQIFYSKKVTSHGQIVGAILADNDLLALKAAQLVKVQYENLEPLILTIEEAIKHQSFFDEIETRICTADVDKILEEAPHKIKGSCRTGNQKHVYMETQRCLVVPGHDGEITIYSSTQSPAHLAQKAAELLNISENKVKVHVRRLGSGIGAKQWKSIVIAQPVILAAELFQRPIRCVLKSDEDMGMSGGRIPYLFHYTVGFDDQGRILACDFDVYGNCGYSLGTSHLLLRNTLHHLDNAFKIPALRARGTLCKTNSPSNPPIKGFGGPEGQFPITYILEEIAEYLHKDRTEIYTINLYEKGSVTFYGQTLQDFNLEKCWNDCITNFKYCERKDEVEEFNSNNIYKKRGISIVPTKMGFEVGNSPLLPAASMINVYTDGSVILCVGAVEMGQGLYTKMTQIATRVLNIPANKIHVEETSTNSLPHCAATAGSMDINLYGAAVMDACKIISERIRPYREVNALGSWEQWVREAYADNVNLSAIGIYKHKSKATDLSNTNNLFDYFVCGVACSMVEIDTLTGDHQLLATDIVVDLGNSLNPAIDIGQIEGGFMQGYGLFVMEETLYFPSGKLYTRGPVSYKIPGFSDIPEQFNVFLLKDTANRGDVFPIKSAAEASQILASSVFYAIKDAIKAARRENGVPETFKLRTPATAEFIRLNCIDPILLKVLERYVEHKPWTVSL